MDQTVIVGGGEVGSALASVLLPYQPRIQDPNVGQHAIHSDIAGSYGYMHICFPYSDTFRSEVLKYNNWFTPKHIIIHSTVPVGTSTSLGIPATTHSPIRGIHPNLESGIRIFVKFLGGPDASQMADYFRRVGLRVMLFDKSETTEAMKLFDTEYYRMCIEFAHEVKRFCDREGLNFHEVYTLANETYNIGYASLGRNEFIRPVLQPIMTPIGGHCVMANKELLSIKA